MLYKRVNIAYFLLLFLAYAGSVYSAGLVTADNGQAANCKTLRDYEKAKTGVYSIAEPEILLKDQQRLSIRVKVDVAQCHKLSSKDFRWKKVNPNKNIEYVHSYNDLDSGEYITRIVTVQKKRVWMAAINSSYKLVATSNIMGDLDSGFIADFDVDVSTIFTPEELALMVDGQSVTGRVGLFLKAIKRYVSDEIVTSYKEVGSGGMYYLLVSMRKEDGKLQLM